MIDGRDIIRSRVAPIKHDYGGYPNESTKFKSWAVYCESSHIAPLFKSGDTLCIDNNGKVAFAKADILSEKRENDHYIRTVRLTKELGHHETLAYEEGYPARVATYQPDESTEQYFGGAESVEAVIESYYATKEKEYEDLCWSFYTGEEVAYNSKVKLAEPFTPQEVLLRLKQKALETLLEDCRGEFCYGDPRVQKYREHYLILGEKNIDTIYKNYKEWLNKNCTTYAQDAESGEFTGIAVDWHDKEDLQPIYDVSGDNVVVKSSSLDLLCSKTGLTALLSGATYDYYFDDGGDPMPARFQFRRADGTREGKEVSADELADDLLSGKKILVFDYGDTEADDFGAWCKWERYQCYLHLVSLKDIRTAFEGFLRHEYEHGCYDDPVEWFERRIDYFNSDEWNHRYNYFTIMPDCIEAIWHAILCLGDSKEAEGYIS